MTDKLLVKPKRTGEIICILRHLLRKNKLGRPMTNHELQVIAHSLKQREKDVDALHNTRAETEEIVKAIQWWRTVGVINPSIMFLGSWTPEQDKQ